MFNLEQSISAWRSQMLAAGIQSPVPLDELESHLRDDIARRMQNGAEPQTAFEAATQEIGGPVMLKKEFAKLQPTGRKLFPLFLPLFASVFSFCIACSVVFRSGNFAEMTPGQRLSSFAALASLLLLSWGGWFGYRAFSFLPTKKARGFLIGSASCLLTLWWTTFFFIVLPRCDFTIAQLLVAILWGFIASSGFIIGVAAGVERAAAPQLKIEN